jgi:hypothetical protein
MKSEFYYVDTMVSISSNVTLSRAPHQKSADASINGTTYYGNEKRSIPHNPYASERNTTSYLKTFFNLTEYIFAAYEFVIADKRAHKNRI